MTAPMSPPIDEPMNPNVDIPPKPPGLDLTALLPGAYSGQSAAYDQTQNPLTRGLAAAGEAGVSQVMMMKGGDVLDLASALGPMIAQRNISWVDLALNNPDIALGAALAPLGFGVMRWKVNAQGKMVPKAGSPATSLIEYDGSGMPIREGSQQMLNSTGNAALQSTPENMAYMASYVFTGTGPGERAGRDYIQTPTANPLDADFEQRTMDNYQDGLTYQTDSLPSTYTAYELRFRLYPGMRSATSAVEIGNSMAAPGGLAAVANEHIGDLDASAVRRGAFIQQYVDHIASGANAHLHPHLDTETLAADLAENPQLAFDSAREDLIKIQALWEKDFISGQLGEEFVAAQRLFLSGEIDIDSPEGKRLLEQWKHLGAVAQAFPNVDIEFRDNPHIRPAQVGLTEDGAYILMAITNTGVMKDSNGGGDVYTTNIARKKPGAESDQRVRSNPMVQTAEPGKPIRYIITPNMRDNWREGDSYLGLANDMDTPLDIQPWEAMATQNVLNLIGFTITDAAEYAGQPNPMATDDAAKKLFLEDALGEDVDLSEPNIVRRLWTDTVGTDTNRMPTRSVAISKNSYGLYSLVLDWTKKKTGMRWTNDTYNTIFGMLSLRAELYGSNLPGFIEWALGWQNPELSMKTVRTAGGGSRQVEVGKLKMSKAGNELADLFKSLGDADDIDAAALIDRMDAWYDKNNGNWEPELDMETQEQKHYTLLDDNIARASHVIDSLNDGEYTQVATFDDYVGIDAETGEVTGPMKLAAMMYEMVVMAKGTAAEKAAVKDSLVRKTWNKANLAQNVEEGTYSGLLPDQTLLTYDPATNTFELANALTGEKIRTFGPASDQVGNVVDGTPVTYADLMQVVDVLYNAPSDMQALTVNDTHQVGALIGIGLPGDSKTTQFAKMVPYQIMTRAILNAMRMYPNVFNNAHAAQALLWSPWRELTGSAYRTAIQPRAMRELNGRSDDPMLHADTINNVNEDAMLPLAGLDIPETHLKDGTGLVYRDSQGNQMYLVRDGYEEMHPGWVVMNDIDIDVRTYKQRAVSTGKTQTTGRKPSTRSEPTMDDAGEPVLTPTGKQKTHQVPQEAYTFHPAVPRSARIVADVSTEWDALKHTAQSQAGEPTRVVSATLHQHTAHSTVLRSGGWTRLMHFAVPRTGATAMRNIIAQAKRSGINVETMMDDAFQSQGHTTPFLVPDWKRVSELSGVELPNEGKSYDPKRDSRLERGDDGEVRQGEAPREISPRSYGASRFRVDAATRGGDFFEGISRTAEDHPFGSAVSVYAVSNYRNPRNTLFLADDGLAGAAVTPEGDLISVFAHPDSAGRTSDILAEAARESITLDAYNIGGFLPNLYARWGFKPVARMKFDKQYAPDGWDYKDMGTPDVVLMVRDPFDVTDLPDGEYSTIESQVPVLDADAAYKLQGEVRAQVIAGRKPVGNINPAEFVNRLGDRLSELTPEELDAVIRVIPEAGTSQSMNAEYQSLAQHGIELEVTDTSTPQNDVYLDFSDSESADKFIQFLYGDLKTTAPEMYKTDYHPESWNEGETRPTPEGNGTRVIDLLGNQTVPWKMYSRDANDLPEHIEAYIRGNGSDRAYEPKRAYEYVATDGTRDVSYVSGEGDFSDPNVFPVIVMSAPTQSTFSEYGDLSEGTSSVHTSNESRPLHVQDINGRIVWGNDLVLHSTTESDVSRLYPDHDIEYVIADSGNFTDVRMRRKAREEGAEWEDMDPPTRIAMYLPKQDQVPIVLGRPLHALQQTFDGYEARQQLSDQATNDVPEVAFDHEYLDDYMVAQRDKNPLRSVEIDIIRGANKMPMYVIKVDEQFPLVSRQASQLLIRSGIRPSRIRLEGMTSES